MFIRYKILEGNTIVGFGITEDIPRRIEEHQREIPDCKMHLLCEPVSEDEARRWGRKQIKAYMRVHGDYPPMNKPRDLPCKD